MKGRKKKVEMLYIGKTWRIDQDNLNFILQKKGSDDTTSWHTVGFYQTMRQLFNALVEHGIKETSISDIKALANKVEELHALIDQYAGILPQSKEGEING